jgi:hypothetical protein
MLHVQHEACQGVLRCAYELRVDIGLQDVVYCRSMRHPLHEVLFFLSLSVLRNACLAFTKF